LYTESAYPIPFVAIAFVIGVGPVLSMSGGNLEAIKSRRQG
jgi:hypothetical protein